MAMETSKTSSDSDLVKAQVAGLNPMIDEMNPNKADDDKKTGRLRWLDAIKRWLNRNDKNVANF